jgi:hypothetical protein
MIDKDWGIEVLMWVVVYAAFMLVGFLIAKVGCRFARDSMQAKIDMAEAKATHWEQLSDQSTTELLELQEDYQSLYRRNTKLREAVIVHRAANATPHCTDLSCPRGCGHDVKLYEVLDETNASVAGLFPTMSVQRSSVWDAVRDGLPEVDEIPDDELPGMWERADFEGGQEYEVRGPDWTPEEQQAADGGWPEVTD